jgi:hypothetical protein
MCTLLSITTSMDVVSACLRATSHLLSLYTDPSLCTTTGPYTFIDTAFDDGLEDYIGKIATSPEYPEAMSYAAQSVLDQLEQVRSM